MWALDRIVCIYETLLQTQLADESVTTSRNWLTLGGAVSQESARPQMSKYKKHLVIPPPLLEVAMCSFYTYPGLTLWKD